MPSVASSIILLSSIAAVSLAVRCYVCNSGYNKKCIENEGIEVQGCPAKLIGSERKEAVGCRLIHQYVAGDFVVVRECAYGGKNGTITNKGSNKISRTTYQCSDKGGCNPAPSFSFLLSSLPALVVALALHR